MNFHLGRGLFNTSVLHTRPHTPTHFPFVLYTHQHAYIYIYVHIYMCVCVCVCVCVYYSLCCVSTAAPSSPPPPIWPSNFLQHPSTIARCLPPSVILHPSTTPSNKPPKAVVRISSGLDLSVGISGTLASQVIIRCVLLSLCLSLA